MAKTATKAAAKTTTKKTAKAKSTTAKSTTTKAKAKTASKAKKTTVKSKKGSKTNPASDEVLNETGNRKTADRRTNEQPVASDRRKTVRRRRQIDPTTCERDYTEQEIQFMHAMDEYKQLSGRMFPTCSEILEVLSKLGYRQIADVQTVYDPDADRNVANDDGDDGSDFESESCV